MIDTTTQEAIAGWNQEKINATNVALVGTGPLAQCALLYLASANFGSVRIFRELNPGDAFFDFLIPQTNHPESANHFERALLLADKMGKTPSNMQVSGTASHFMPSLASRSTVIFDATNDPYSKYQTAVYASQRNLPFISASASLAAAQVVMVLPDQWKYHNPNKYSSHLLYPFRQAPRGSITSLLAAALSVEAIRKAVCPIRNDKPAHHGFVFNLRSPTLFGLDQSIAYNPSYDYSHLKALVVGAGALGNGVCLGLSLLGFDTVTVADYKTIDPTNLSRQPLYLFGDFIGKRKADALSEVLNNALRCPSYRHQTTFIPKYAKFGDEITEAERTIGIHQLTIDDLLGYDILFSCVDNDQTRMALDPIAESHSLPLLDGAVSENGGIARLYYPPHTPSLTLQGASMISSRPSPIQEEIGCAGGYHAPSVGYINAATAALMLAMGTRALQGLKPYPTPLEYAGQSSTPISTNSEVNPR